MRCSVTSGVRHSAVLVNNVVKSSGTGTHQPYWIQLTGLRQSAAPTSEAFA
jgi:hypothetical protein